MRVIMAVAERTIDNIHHHDLRQLLAADGLGAPETEEATT